MTRTLFLHMVLRKFIENINDKPIFSQYNNFYKYKCSFFDLCSDLFSVVAKFVNQIGYNVVCDVARPVFVFCFALTTGRCNAFQHIFVNQKKSELYDPHFQTMLFLGAMVQCFFGVLGRIFLPVINVQPSSLIFVS